MSDLLTSFDEFDEKLKFMQKVGYGKRSIPCQLDNEVSKLIQAFVNATDEDRELVTSMLSKEHSAILITFSKRMAALAVRRKSKRILLEGLLALILEGWKVDWRNNIVSLSLVYHSALKLGVLPQEFFNEASKFTRKEIEEKLNNFLQRNENDRSIEAMGYKEAIVEDGFGYECTW